MTNKHTPGPWEVSKHATPEYAPQYGVYTGNGNDFAIVNGDNATADAALIAAAPELLAALQDMLNNFGANDTDTPFIVNARAAIAKAKA